MKKAAGIILVLVVSVAVAWQFRLELLMWGAPKVSALREPVGASQPVPWPPGPARPDVPIAQRPPNIILILADDMGFNDVSFYNGGAADGSVMTPNIDRIALDGVAFQNGYAANAVCAPSRASLMTGRYSTRFGFEFTPFFRLGTTIFQWMQDQQEPALPTYIDHEKARALPPMQSLGMPASEFTIAELLKNAGYYTAHIGKWHLGGVAGMRPEDQGFDDSLNMAGTLYLPEDHPHVVNAKRERDGIDRMVWATGRYAMRFNSGPLFEPDGYLTDYFTDQALEVIDSHRHEPFFLYLAHWGIHNPLQARRSDYEQFAHIEDHTLRVYAAMIHALDRGVGRVMQRLRDHRIDDNTLIVFTSDNGGAGYIGLPDVNKPFRGWKLTHFEGGIHVPFFARWPAHIPAATTVGAPIHHADLYRTFASAAGASGEVPGDRKLDSLDLLPHIGADRVGLPSRSLFWREGHQQAVQHEGWKLIRAARPDKTWLFDLNNDPVEKKNVANQNPERVKRLTALLEAHNLEQAEPRWPSVLDSPQLIDKTGVELYAPDDEYVYWPN